MWLVDGKVQAVSGALQSSRRCQLLFPLPKHVFFWSCSKVGYQDCGFCFLGGLVNILWLVLKTHFASLRDNKLDSSVTNGRGRQAGAEGLGGGGGGGGQGDIADTKGRDSTSVKHEYQIKMQL